MSIWTKILDGLLVAGTAAVIGGAIMLIGFLASTKKCLESVLHNQTTMSKMISSLMVIKGPTLAVQRAILDVLTEKKINGTVTKAYKELDEADREFSAAVAISIRDSCGVQVREERK